MNDEKEVYRQFLIDAPRINIIVDENPWSHDAHTLYNYIMNRYRNGMDIVYWCTQTALAGIYFKKLSQIRNIILHTPVILHLIDGGKQTNTLQANGIVVQKPFYVCTVDSEEGRRIIKQLLLTVQAYDNSTVTIEWTTTKKNSASANAQTTEFGSAADGVDESDYVKVQNDDDDDYEFVNGDDLMSYKCRETQDPEKSKLGIALAIALAIALL